MNGGGNFADGIVNSALRFRAQAPLIDQLLREIGIEGGDIQRLVGSASGATFALPPAAPQQSPVMRVYVSSVIDASADTVWSRVRDFNALPLWHPAIADSRIENSEPSDRVGCIRHFHTRDGATIRECLLALSDYDFSCTYEIFESPMGVSDCVATLELTPVTDGVRCFAEWSAEFDCAEGREAESTQTIGSGVFQAGCDALKRHFGRR